VWGSADRWSDSSAAQALRALALKVACECARALVWALVLAAEGAVEGVAEGAVEGVAEGAVEGAVECLACAVLEGRGWELLELQLALVADLLPCVAAGELLPEGDCCAAALLAAEQNRLAVRSPHALHKVMPHRHLGVCVVPQDWHTRLVTSGTRFVLRSEVIARGIAPLKVASAAAVSASRPLRRLNV